MGIETVMKAVDLTPCLLVEDLEKNLRFYGELLHFRLILHFPQRPPYEWVVMENGYVNLMFRNRASVAETLRPPEGSLLGAGVILTLQVEDLQRVYAALKEQVTMLDTPHQNLYGATEFTFSDSNGYLISIIQDDF